MAQFIDVARKNNARGIDSYSPRGNIGEGYAEGLANVDTNANGKLSTRAGYQGYAGWVPLRVTKMSHIGTSIALQFDSSQTISLETAVIGPLIIAGKVPSTDAPMGGYMGDFSDTFSVHYYPSYVLNNKDPVAVGPNTIIKTVDQTGLLTPYIFTGLSIISTSGVDNTVIMVDSTTIDTADYEIDIGLTSTSAAAAVFYYKDKSAQAGTTYIASVTAQTSVAVTAGTHGLTNFNIMARCYDTVIESGKLTEVLPDSVTISNIGTVTVTFTTAFTGDIILTRVPLDNVKVAAPSNGTNLKK